MQAVPAPSEHGGGTTSPSLRERRQVLLARTDLVGAAFCQPFADAVDDWLSTVADAATNGDPSGLALVAVGGYGRGQLCPYSDLDLVLMHAGRSDVARVADAIWYPVWDQGMKLDHSVRRPREVLDAARGDLRVALGLLDGRVVWGDRTVAEPVLAQAVEQWRSRLGARWLPDLEAQMLERHAANGDVAYLLEPDLKEGHGGLRDVNVWQAIEQYAPALRDHADLDATYGGAAVLTGVRVELHRLAGRDQDRLLLQDQDQVAEALGDADADVLMARVAEAGNAIAWAADDAWRRRPLWEPAGAGRKGGRGGDRLRGRGRRSEDGPDAAADTPAELEAGISVLGGEVYIAPSATLDDPTLALRLAAVSAEKDLPLSRVSLATLSEAATAVPEPWPEPVRDALTRLLAAGRPAISAIEALDRFNLWARYLPEWSAVRNRPQRNAYHRFTVDRHLLEATANAAALADHVDRPDLLLLGTLLHDIGKGYPGDHSTVGVDLVTAIGHRMGYPPADIAVLCDLVRHHLLLPDTATRRDLDDPATIQLVAARAPDRGTVQLLAALTEADSLATGPSAWGTWKAGLVHELAVRVDGYLAGGETPETLGWITEADRKQWAGAVEDHRMTLRIEAPRVVVAAPDRPGLLSAVTGVLALHGLGVRSADVMSESGVALEAFIVDAANDRWPEAATIVGDVRELIGRRFVLRDRLAAKARAYAPRRPSSARAVKPSVVIDNTASASATVIDVRALDEIGLLHRVTRAVLDCALDVVSARVATIGSEVVDAFYVRDAAGRKVEDPAGLASLESAIARAIGVRPDGDEAAAGGGGRGAG